MCLVSRANKYVESGSLRRASRRLRSPLMRVVRKKTGPIYFGGEITASRINKFVPLSLIFSERATYAGPIE